MEIIEFLVGMGMTMFLLSIVFYILLIVAGWKIFEKAGEAGWKSIIPVYNLYIYFKISWEAKWFWINLALMAVGSFLRGMDGGVAALGIIAIFAAGAINVVQVYKLAKAFGHGVGFTLGLLFLPNVFQLILGFGSSVYQGPQI